MNRTSTRRGLVVAFVVAITTAAALLASGSAGAASFGQVFQLNNPTNPFALGVQDVEPSVRVDTLGNVFPGAIRGVPAGVDLWRVSPPYDSAHYQYLGQPDAPPIPGVGPGQDEDPGVGLGGGDIDIASSCETNLLNVSSLMLSQTNNFQSADQGNSFAATV